MVAPEIRRIGLLPKQHQFIQDDEHSAILYSGALAAGKSRALCYRAARLASRHPHARVGLARKSMVSLKKTTLVTLLENDGDLPPVLEPGTYKYAKQPGEIAVRLFGAGTIIPFGCDDPLSFGSLNLSDLCIDEGIELDRDEWNMLDGRCRIQFWLPYTAEGQGSTPLRDPRKSRNRNTIAVATNPGPPTHFLHELFFDQPSPERLLIETRTAENFFLPRDYIPRLLSHMHGPAKKRYLDGIWCAMEGMVFPHFDPSVHIVHEAGPWDYFVTGVDYGFTHKMAVRVWGVRRRGGGPPRCHCVAEWYQSGATSPSVVAICKESLTVYPRSRFVVDANARDLIEQLRGAGLQVKAGKSNPGDVLPGIRTVGSALGDRVEGVPRATFEPGLTGTDEYMSYCWSPGAMIEQPIKKDDDAVDADRYALVDIHDYGTALGLYVGGRSVGGELDDFERQANITRPEPEIDPLDDRYYQ